MLPAGCSRRLVAELRDALDACAERQRQLEQSLRVSRRLLRTWEPAETPAAEPTRKPETDEEGPPPAGTPSPQDLRELELLTQALEKAVRVRKGISKAGEKHKALRLKSGSTATSRATTASAPSRASGQAGRRASETKSPRGVHQTTVPARGLPECSLPSVGDRTHMGRGAPTTKPGPGLRDQQIPPSAVPRASEAFTLKEKGTLLKLPMAYRKAASQNSRLWAQLSSTQTSDSRDAASTAKAQFLQKMKMTVFLVGLWDPPPPGGGGPLRVVLALSLVSLRRNSRKGQSHSGVLSWAGGEGGEPGCRGVSLTHVQSGWPGSGLAAAEAEAEVGLLRKACSLLRQRMEEVLSADPADPMQEYYCLLTLEGLQAFAGQCLHRLQEVRAALAGQQLGPWPEGRCRRASVPCGGRTDPTWSPQLLLYSSPEELQSLAALGLRVAMLDQQIHLQKVLMADLLPLVSMREPPGLPWLALCRAVHSLLCEGGERFLTILQDEPAD